MTGIPPHAPTPYWLDDEDCLASGSADAYVTVADLRCASAKQRQANGDFILRACNAHGPLLEAIDKLVETAIALDAAIDGVTDQFDEEVADLQRAIRHARHLRLSLDGGAS